MAAAAATRQGPGGDLPLPSTIDVAALHSLAEATVRAHGRATVTPAGAAFRQMLMERARTSAARSPCSAPTSNGAHAPAGCA